MGMSKVYRVVTFVALSSLSALLSGCGDNSPSEADIKSAIQQNIDSMNASLKPVVGDTVTDDMKFKLVSAKKLSCGDKQSDGSYKCNVDLTVKQPMIGENKNTVELTFVKGDDGWHELKTR